MLKRIKLSSFWPIVDLDWIYHYKIGNKMSNEVFCILRPTSPSLDYILGQAIPVLDHGFIRVIDYMGDDSAIVQAARVSYGTGTKQRNEDEGLIRYLMRHNHSTPFEMCELKLHVKLPIFVARQWIRHRTANVNEYSARYSVVDQEFYVPSSEHLAEQSKSNKQGRGNSLTAEDALKVQNLLLKESARAYEDYEALLDDKGLARELARMRLTLNYYTEWYWKIDLHNLFHFVRLRSDPHAQYEIRAYADAILDKILRVWVPIATKAFEDYKMGAMVISAKGISLLKRMLAGEDITKEESNMSLSEWNEFKTWIS